MNIKLRGFLRAALVIAALMAGGFVPEAHGQGPWSKFGSANGVLKGSASSYQTSSAVAADIYGLWSGTCSSSTFLNGAGSCAVPTGTGISFSAPSIFTVTGSPGTAISISFASGQTANQILATPDGVTGAAGLRSLVAGDLPPINLGSTANGGVSNASILLGTNGGTSNGFFSVVGPATSLKTFTFPNSSATVLTSASAVTVAQGGTGLGTLTTHGVLLGEGTSNVGSVAAMSLDTLLQGQGTGADPAAVSLVNCGSSTQALSYSTSTHTFGCQTLSGGGGTPGGSTGSIQFNTSGAFNGDSFLQYDNVNLLLSITGNTANFPVFKECNSSNGSGLKCWTERISSTGSWAVTPVNDAGSLPGNDGLSVSKNSSNVVTAVAVGNATDNPTVTINGRNAGASIVCTTACSASGLQVGQSVTVAPQSGVSRTSNTTLADDTNLQVTNLPAGTYSILYTLQFLATNSTGGVKWEISMGAGSQVELGNGGISDCNTTTTPIVYSGVANTGSVPQVCTITSNSGVTVNGSYVRNSVPSGTFAIRWAQNSSNASATTLSQNSGLVLTRLN